MAQNIPWVKGSLALAGIVFLSAAENFYLLKKLKIERAVSYRLISTFQSLLVLAQISLSLALPSLSGSHSILGYGLQELDDLRIYLSWAVLTYGALASLGLVG